MYRVLSALTALLLVSATASAGSPTPDGTERTLRYEAGGEGWGYELTLERIGTIGVEATIEVVSGHHTGSFTGSGLLEDRDGRTLVEITSDPADDDGFPPCTLTVEFHDDWRRVTTSEDGCTPWHGAGASFDGEGVYVPASTPTQAKQDPKSAWTR